MGPTGRSPRVHGREVCVGLVYLGAAIVLGATFLWLALVLRRQTTPRHASVLFHYSLLYLALLFVAMAVDPLIQ